MSDWIITLDTQIEHAVTTVPPDYPTDAPVHEGLPAVETLRDLRDLVRVGGEILAIEFDESTGEAGYRCRLPLRTAFSLSEFDDEVIAHAVISASAVGAVPENVRAAALDALIPQIAAVRAQVAEAA